MTAWRLVALLTLYVTLDLACPARAPARTSAGGRRLPHPRAAVVAPVEAAPAADG